jgi:hypothetical protein
VLRIVISSFEQYRVAGLIERPHRLSEDIGRNFKGDIAGPPRAASLRQIALADKHTVIVDQRVVSTMSLPPAALVAEEMVRLLEREHP